MIFPTVMPKTLLNCNQQNVQPLKPCWLILLLNKSQGTRVKKAALTSGLAKHLKHLSLTSFLYLLIGTILSKVPLVLDAVQKHNFALMLLVSFVLVEFQ